MLKLLLTSWIVKLIKKRLRNSSSRNLISNMLSMTRKYEGYELKQRLTQVLARKGYDFSDIASALREYTLIFSCKIHRFLGNFYGTIVNDKLINCRKLVSYEASKEGDFITIQSYKHDGSLHRTWRDTMVLKTTEKRHYWCQRSHTCYRKWWSSLGYSRTAIVYFHKKILV